MSSKTLILCAAVLAGAFAACWPAASRAADDELTRMLDEFSSADQAAGHSSGTACLTPAQRRHVAASGKVVPLSKAIRAARARKKKAPCTDHESQADTRQGHSPCRSARAITNGLVDEGP